MIALAHVETQSTGDVTRIRKIRGVIGTHVAAAIGGLLERNAVLMTLGDIEEGAAIGPDQSFVGREDHKIRIEAFDVHRQHAGTLRRVDQEDGALAAERGGDRLDVDQPAIRPVHR